MSNAADAGTSSPTQRSWLSHPQNTAAIITGCFALAVTLVTGAFAILSQNNALPRAIQPEPSVTTTTTTEVMTPPPITQTKTTTIPPEVVTTSVTVAAEAGGDLDPLAIPYRLERLDIDSLPPESLASGWDVSVLGIASSRVRVTARSFQSVRFVDLPSDASTSAANCRTLLGANPAADGKSLPSKGFASAC